MCAPGEAKKNISPGQVLNGSKVLRECGTKLDILRKEKKGRRDAALKTWPM